MLNLAVISSILSFGVRRDPTSVAGGTLCSLGLQVAKVVVEAIEALFPQAPIGAEPIVNALERSGDKPARPPLRHAASGDEARAFQHLEMLGDGWTAYFEGLESGEFAEALPTVVEGIARFAFKAANSVGT